MLAIALVVAFSLNAQDIKVGAKAGYGMSGYIMNFDKPDHTKMGNGFHFGIVGEMNLGPVGGRLDISYIQMGSDFYNEGDVAGTSFISDIKTNVHYIQVGVAAKKALGPVYAFAGPYVAYAFKNESNWEFTYDGTTEELVIDNYKDLFDDSDSDFYNKFDYGLYGGAGVEIKGVFVEVYAGVGLMNFLNESSDEYYDFQDDAIEINDNDLDARDENFRYTKGSSAVEEPSQNNLFFGFSVGYLFGF